MSRLERQREPAAVRRPGRQTGVDEVADEKPLDVQGPIEEDVATGRMRAPRPLVPLPHPAVMTAAASATAIDAVAAASAVGNRRTSGASPIRAGRTLIPFSLMGHCRTLAQPVEPSIAR